MKKQRQVHIFIVNDDDAFTELICILRYFFQHYFYN